MKQEKITLTVGEATIKLPAATVAQLALASVLGQITPASLPPRILPDPVMVPEIGQAWPGQGGINGGFVPAHGDVPAHYLIFAAKDVGDCKWGGYGTESKATSKTDGLANTDALITEGDHPAAMAARKYEADGHKDFYLPAAAELYQGWLNCPEVFAQDRWHWSSSQRSAYFAFYMGFADGLQGLSDKGYELRVRPVRRFFI
ncbi:DUF1566 domain-containing protein [Pseudomonas alloputida]|uniref:DUF1566 domain-containing protein n=1 Tax=Pseudomonas alloputida TaxID=1940621 RepID=A0AAW7HHY2_9PSED|nr:DUF1566 domain-containing protein [Pseudomonas alloputida]MDM3952870.1 DUF1566 domain-containing protein [Pseudomonas alloputida]